MQIVVFAALIARTYIKTTHSSGAGPSKEERVKKALTLFICFVFVAAICIFVYENRASEKVVSIFVIAFTVYVGTVSAGIYEKDMGKSLIAIWLSTFVFVAAVLWQIYDSVEQPAPQSFSVSFILDPKTHLPLAPARAEGNSIDKAAPTIIGLLRRYPPAPTDTRLRNLFNALLQRAIIDWMARVYSQTWHIERSLNLPRNHRAWAEPVEGARQSEILNSIDIAENFRGNIGRDRVLDAVNDKELVLLPKGTRVVVRSPSADAAPSEWGEILFNNRLGNVSIATQKTDPDPTEDARYFAFTIVFRRKFNRWLSGDPDMCSYRMWAQTFERLLRIEFDEELLAKRSQAVPDHEQDLSIATCEEGLTPQFDRSPLRDLSN